MFISWLQHRLLGTERMLDFEGDAAGDELHLFVLDCKSPLSAGEMLLKSMKTKQKLLLVVKVPMAEQILCILP